MKKLFRKLKRKLVSKWTHRAYLENIEFLVKEAANASLTDEMNSIDFDGIDGIKYGDAFHKAFTKLRRELRYTHYKGDGCVDHE